MIIIIGLLITSVFVLFLYDVLYKKNILVTCFSLIVIILLGIIDYEIVLRNMELIPSGLEMGAWVPAIISIYSTLVIFLVSVVLSIFLFSNEYKRGVIYLVLLNITISFLVSYMAVKWF